MRKSNSQILADTMNRGLAKLKLLILFGAAIALISIGIGQMVKAHESRSWPVIAGTIDDARITVLKKDSSDAEYAVQIRYHYTVNGMIYSASRVSFDKGYNSNSRTEAEASLHRLTSSGSVLVHYDPGDPAEAVLAPDQIEGCWALVAFGLFIFAITLLLGHRELKAFLNWLKQPGVRKWPTR